MNQKIKIPDTAAALLRKLGVAVVYLFGSRAESIAHEFSDFDIGVVFRSLSFQRSRSDLYNKLYDIFTDIFPEQKLDLVFLQDAGLEISTDAIVHGKILFQSSLDERLAFEEKTLLFYADFKPILNEMDSAILKRI